MQNKFTIKQKLTNYYYFIIFNSILACVIGIGYWVKEPNSLHVYPPKLTELIDIFYIITTHFSIITLVVFVISITILPTIYLKTKLAILLQFLLFSMLIAILTLDVRMFQFDGMHLFTQETNNLIEITGTKEAIFTINKAIALTLIILFVITIYKINQWIYNTNYLTDNKIATKFSILLLISCIISMLSYQTSSTEKKHKMLAYMQYLFINKHNNYAINEAYKLIQHGEIQYPLQSLQTNNVNNPPNILIIAMDAWRADCFNEQDSPNLWKFAKQGKIFYNHFSGGNHTRRGLFSLFYSIPAIHCDKFEKQKVPALLFSRLKQLDYQINCFAAGENKFLEIYTNIKDLYIFSKDTILPYKEDHITNKNWLNWYNSLDKAKPWFSFIFYDALHGPYFPANYSKKSKPAVSTRFYKEFARKYGKDNFINSYKTAVHYGDSLANKILQHLKNTNDLDNTIIIITGDHGCEWDDNNQGKWGYGSNFTNCQIQVPFAIIIPNNYKFNLNEYATNLTSHHDLVPTLMKNFLGVQNNIADYSIGRNLLSNATAKIWCLAFQNGGYRYFKTEFNPNSAIIENDQVFKFNHQKLYFLDKFNQWKYNKTINIKYLNQALECMTRFIKK